RQVPVVLTLHDAWLLSGHCAHSYRCERWRTGCGHCPDLATYPPVRRDATAYNWRRKHQIYRRSRLYVASPCQWLMRKVEQSMLASGVVGARVIPNGVDLAVFQPVDKRSARAALGLPAEAKVLLFTANKWIRDSITKAYQTMRAAGAQAAEPLQGRRVLFLALGEDAPAERVGQAEIRFIPYQRAPAVVASYYQAADIYLHAAKVDTFPTTILEALACGTPVVATAVCGIPEQVKSFQDAEGRWPDGVGYPGAEARGILVAPGDGPAMAAGVHRLLTDEALAHRLGENAARDAGDRFGLSRQVDRYLEWYEELVSKGGACGAFGRGGR